MGQISIIFDWGWRKKSWKKRIEVWGWRNEDLEFKIEGAGLRTGNQNLRIPSSHINILDTYFCLPVVANHAILRTLLSLRIVYNFSRSAYKGLRDKSLKIKNLRWQFSCIFCRHCLVILRFFSRCCFHGDVCRSKLSLLKIFKKVNKRTFSVRQNLPLRKFVDSF